MENNSTQVLDNGYSSGNNLNVSEASKGYLSETGKWAKFLSVLGFVFIGLIVVGGLFAGAIFSTMIPGGQGGSIGSAMGLVYIVLGLIYFFPIYYLFKFSTNIKKAITDLSTENLDLALSNLKSHYKFFGISTIVILAFYILIAIIGGVAFLASR